MLNSPAPYRVDFLNCIAKEHQVDVIYGYHLKKHRDARWLQETIRNYSECYASDMGSVLSQFRKLRQKIQTEQYDAVIVGGYGAQVSRQVILACRALKKEYYIEYDGGFNKKDPWSKWLVKHFFIAKAKGHFVPADEVAKYLRSHNVDDSRILRYAFTSLNAEDILDSVPCEEEKKELRQKLGMSGEKIILTVGQFIHRKGMDVLMKAASRMPKSYDIYIIGGAPSDEYISIKEELKLDNVHFVDFMGKAELKKWYQAADVFVFPTREDIWGLVINEAMANGLPVLSTDRSVAALELVKDGYNGCIVPAENPEALAAALTKMIAADQCVNMGRNGLRIIKDYTIEKMVCDHLKVLNHRT